MSGSLDAKTGETVSINSVVESPLAWAVPHVTMIRPGTTPRCVLSKATWGYPHARYKGVPSLTRPFGKLHGAWHSDTRKEGGTAMDDVLCLVTHTLLTQWLEACHNSARNQAGTQRSGRCRRFGWMM